MEKELRKGYLINKGQICAIGYISKGLDPSHYIEINVGAEIISIDYESSKEWYNDVLKITDFIRSKNEAALRILIYSDKSVIMEELFEG